MAGKMKKGDSVVVVTKLRNMTNGADHVGRTGVIRTERSGWGPTIDVRLDFPLSDRRQHIWFYRSELQVI